jgi:hypothetical protein
VLTHDQEIIILCARWYVTYKLSYRDLAAMTLERGISVAPSTIFRWSNGTCPSSRSAWIDSLARSVVPGEHRKRAVQADAEEDGARVRERAEPHGPHHGAVDDRGDEKWKAEKEPFGERRDSIDGEPIQHAYALCVGRLHGRLGGCGESHRERIRRQRTPGRKLIPRLGGLAEPAQGTEQDAVLGCLAEPGGVKAILFPDRSRHGGGRDDRGERQPEQDDCRGEDRERPRDAAGGAARGTRTGIRPL